MNQENAERYKASRWPVIQETVYSLLPDLKRQTVEKLLDGRTPEELIEHCKRRYDEEFDLHFPSLGLAGANEVAWHEVFSSFDDEVWS